MKANKFFAVALAALAMVSFVACDDKKDDDPAKDQLKLNETEISLEVDKTFTLEANMAVSFESSNVNVASVTPANDGKSAVIKGIAAGEANITAISQDGQKAICKVTVSGGVTPPPAEDAYKNFPELQGSEYYVFFLQKGAADYLGDKILYSFAPNDHLVDALGKNQGSRWLYTWDNTFVGGETIGTDPFDMGEGWLAMKQVTGGTWAGMGLCVAINDGNNESGEGAAEDLAALNSMKSHITNYEEWYFAIAVKNKVSGAAYDITLIGSNVNDVEAGKGVLPVSPLATGEWVYMETKLSEISGLEFGEWNHNGSNVFTVLANPYSSGTQFDLGYAFIYKK